MVISGKEGSGKKHLITNWIKFHKEKEEKSNRRFQDLIIPHFHSGGGNDKSYSFALYNVLIKLKEHLDIHQKIELETEKLRRYFSFWLDVSSRKLSKRIVDDSQIVLVIEGADKFINIQSLEFIPLDFWLPTIFPDRIRCIITVDSDS